MEDHEIVPRMVAVFRALSDENRLKIIGLLAERPYTVEALVEPLGVSVSTVSHHLNRLAKAGLVRAEADGHHYLYALQMDYLKEMTHRLTQKKELKRISEEKPEETFERKVMRSFVLPNGRIKAFPVQEKKFLVILRYVLQAFEPEKRYPEKQVNEILGRYNDDTAQLRRELVEYGMMEREGGGGDYWRTSAEQEPV